MKLSIIVPVFNVEAYLHRCLQSLLDQNLEEEDYEIIVVNDGTPDNSMDIVEQFSKKHTNIVVFEQENKGLSGARNSGITLAKGKYVYFIDSDDYIASNTLHSVLSVMENNDLDILGFGTKTTTSLELLESTTTDFNAQDIEIQNGLDYIASHKYLNNVWWYFIKREFLLATEISFIEGVMLEDGIYTAELFSKAQKIAKINLDVYRYVQRETSIMHNKSEAHYNKLIADFEHIIFKYNDLVLKIQKNHPDHPSLKRLISRKESYIFFLIARIVKSNLSFQYLNTVLNRLKKNHLYPIYNFVDEDNKGIQYKILTFIFNRPLLLRMFLFFYRMLLKP
ncbi:glycosyltransferase [Spongiimicrobium salis]|uniref:glycosyltransferase n=1 Tax=Spongiimicrobium salis TaxID=1667022 RepID=UPI00374D5D85